MDAEFVTIQDAFQQDGRGLEVPVLDLLIPNAALFETLAIQPSGKIAVSSNFIGHFDQQSAIARFTKFFELADEQKPALVVSPEYSCPWSVLKDAIRRRKTPTPGKLWILGSEAITPHDLERLKAEFADDADVLWVHEPLPNGPGNFLDVIVYVLQAKIAGVDKIALILQFKTHHMGGDHFERDHLKRGHVIYVLHNPQDNIRLISLNCSEALVFDQAAIDECGFDTHPFFIFHPQLTADPHHTDISAYRSLLFAHAQGNDTDILSLNWARGFQLPNREPSDYGGSAIYTKQAGFDFSPGRLQDNHSRGFYYTFWRRHYTDICFLNFDQFVFHFRSPKAYQNVLEVNAGRTGPEMLNLWEWDTNSQSWQPPASVNDGFDQLCAEYQTPCNFCATAPHTALDRERLLTLSTGRLIPEKNWYEIRNLAPFICQHDERSKRLTFTHDESQPSREFRIQCVGNFVELQTVVLANPVNFPDLIADLRDNWRVTPPIVANEFRFNLTSQNGRAWGATAIFVDMLPPSTVEQLRNQLIEAWGRSKTLRLVIWYRFQGAIRSFCPPEFRFTEDSALPESIIRTE